MAVDYIPKKNVDFDTFQDNLVTIVVPSAVGWGITPADTTQLQNLQAVWVAAWAISQVFATSTPTDRFNTEQARINYEAFIRLYVKLWLKYNSLITPAELTSMGITIDDTIRTHHPAPAFSPLVETIAKSAGVIRIVLKVAPEFPGDNGRHFPPFTKSARIVWKVGGAAPASITDFNNNQYVTKVGNNLQFSVLEQRGLVVYFSAFYLSSTGEESPMSAPIIAYVP